MTRKAKYASGRKVDVLRGTVLTPNASVETRYYRQLRQLILHMSRIVENELKAFFNEQHAKEYFALDASVSSQARILLNELQKRFDDLFGLKAKGISEQIADDSSKTSATALNVSLKEIGKGLMLKTDFLTGELNDVLKATISENVGLIKSIPAQYMDGIQGAVYRSITTGRGLADLVPFIKNYEGVTLRRAKLIASDQTSKAFSNINRVRLEKLGVKKFEWVHSQGGQHPRPLHKNVLNGEIFSWDEPPIIDEKTGERGFPGTLINCRCKAAPVISFED